MNLQWSKAQYQMFFEDSKLARIRTYPKGRRFGATRGAMQAFFIKMLDGVTPLLWLDVNQGNITRYKEMYLNALLNRLPKDSWKYHGGINQLIIDKSIADFRSVTRLNDIEGMNYRLTFVNEAGIILKNRYVIENAIKPMLFDNSDSELICAGTPKGFNYFYELSEKGRKQTRNHLNRVYTTFDNPWINEDNVRELTEEIPEVVQQQEIYGQFISDELTLVKPSYIRRWDQPLPTPLTITVGVDLAISEKQSADYTAIAVLGRHRETGRIFIIDIRRDRVPFHRVLPFIEGVARTYRAELVGVESNQFQIAVAQELLRQTTLPIKPVHSYDDKVSRFMPVAARYEQGLIYHTPGLHKEYEKELLGFPNNCEHDDMVDAVSLAYKSLDSLKSMQSLTIRDL